MTRLGYLLLVGGVLAGPALAQEAPITVAYDSVKADSRQVVNQAIDQALKDAAFIRQQKPGPDTLVLTVPQAPQDSYNNKNSVRFTLVFTRGGDRIGESVELCSASPPFDCVAQIVSDIKSAAAIAGR